jgi:cysteine desulfurase
MKAAAPIYLDYAATTPVDPLVAQAMSECLSEDGDFANPASSTHGMGRRAQARVERARDEVAALIGAEPSEIIFTSGATESNNLAILGAARAGADRGRHIVTSRIEHRAVLDPCRHLEKEGFAVTYLAPDRSGRIAPEALAAALRADTVLVSLMQVNNEIGVVSDIAAFGALCAEHGVLLHTDAAQSAGRLAVDVRALPVAFLSFTAHKLYGPKGIGALYVRAGSRARLRPLTFGGGQERGLRPGTLPTHQMVGFALACTLARKRHGEPARLTRLRDRLWSGLARLEGVHLNGAAAMRIPDILSVSFEGLDGESLVTGLTELALATGSACSSATGEPSYVMRALGRSSALAQSTLRLSLGRGTTESDIDRTIHAVTREVLRLRAAAPGAFSTKITPDAGILPTDGGMFEFDILSPLARQLFGELPGAGQLPAGPGVLRGEAGGADGEVWVCFYLHIDGDVVKDARFQARACPHTLAVAAWLTGRLPGRAVSGLGLGKPAEWAQALDVPVEKLGRLLVVEDALQACLILRPSLSVEW